MPRRPDTKDAARRRGRRLHRDEAFQQARSMLEAIMTGASFHEVRPVVTLHVEDPARPGSAAYYTGQLVAIRTDMEEWVTTVALLGHAEPFDLASIETIEIAGGLRSAKINDGRERG